MSSFWDDRYGRAEYIYGEAPNAFFAEQLGKLKPGTIILPCEGEGRNAVYAASLGWEVRAFDASEAGKAKAMALAAKKGATIEYLVNDALDARYEENSADVVCLIFAHFVPEIRMKVHQEVIRWLKPGGKIILEVFNTQQLQNNSGGPKDIALLYTTDMLEKDFATLETDMLLMAQTELDEGSFHQGRADVLRYLGTKKQG